MKKIALALFTLLVGCQTTTASVPPPTYPAEPTAVIEMVNRCFVNLVGDQDDAYKRAMSDLTKKNGDAYAWGALMKHYYSCSKDDAFNIYWASRGILISGGQVATKDRGDINAVWIEFQKGWDGK